MGCKMKSHSVIQLKSRLFITIFSKNLRYNVVSSLMKYPKQIPHNFTNVSLSELRAALNSKFLLVLYLLYIHY